MEIPTEKVLESLMVESVTLNGTSTIKEATLMVSIATIKAQAREILDLQATIVRLKDEFRISNDLRNEFPEPGCWTGRITKGK